MIRCLEAFDRQLCFLTSKRRKQTFLLSNTEDRSVGVKEQIQIEINTAISTVFCVSLTTTIMRFIRRHCTNAISQLGLRNIIIVQWRHRCNPHRGATTIFRDIIDHINLSSETRFNFQLIECISLQRKYHRKGVRTQHVLHCVNSRGF